MSQRVSSVRSTGRRSRLSEPAAGRAFWSWLLSGGRWLLRYAIGPAFGLLALVLVALGVFRNGGVGGPEPLLALAGLTVFLLVRLFDRLQRSRANAGRWAFWADLELGTLFVAAAFVLIELTGGPGGLLYPLIYAVVAFLVAFHRPLLSIYFLVLILGTEAAVLLLQGRWDNPKLFISHASFVLLFGLLYALFLRGEVAQRRHRLESEIESHLDAIARDAREFRLTSGLSLDSREMSAVELRNRRRVGSVQAIHEALYNVLAVAERALRPYTVALLWLDADDRRLRIKELRSQSDRLVEGPISAGEGLLGAITKRREPIVLTNLKAGHSGLVYYRRPEAITDFVGVPVCEGAHLRGVLVADRTDGRPFDEPDIAVMTTVAAEIVRAVQVERIFADMDAEKYQREQFYQASRAFNSALTVDEVAGVAIEVARRVAQAQFAAVAVSGEEPGVMQVVAVNRDGQEEGGDLLGLTFQADEGLVGAAIKARHPLPHGTARASQQSLFAAGDGVRFDQVKVLPLLLKEQGVGALVLGSDNDDFLPLDAVEMLRVIADHAAITIANAQMYERMQRMATTDGLTGLANHRHFQEQFEVYLARAERYGHRLSVILLDIDHFKSINDTYGHPVGDMVLRRLGALLNAGARKTDIAARYGGEEFVLLMEQTDVEAAIQTAERLRTTVEQEPFRCEVGAFTCTLSLGVATYPMHATQKALLLECADQALYQAKRGGRNRVVAHRPG